MVEITLRIPVKIAFEDKVRRVGRIRVESHETAEMKAAHLPKRQLIIACRVSTQPGEQISEFRLVARDDFGNDGKWILFSA